MLYIVCADLPKEAKPVKGKGTGESNWNATWNVVVEKTDEGQETYFLKVC